LSVQTLLERDQLNFRQALGSIIRDERTGNGRTLREVSAQSLIALGYLSEIERGKKEVSSDILHGICEALDISLSDLLRRTADLLDESQ
jgi:transcriptional regulator with XRE-family HTH domain